MAQKMLQGHEKKMTPPLYRSFDCCVLLVGVYIYTVHCKKPYLCLYLQLVFLFQAQLQKLWLQWNSKIHII